MRRSTRDTTTLHKKELPISRRLQVGIDNTNVQFLHFSFFYQLHVSRSTLLSSQGCFTLDWPHSTIPAPPYRGRTSHQNHEQHIAQHASTTSRQWRCAALQILLLQPIYGRCRPVLDSLCSDYLVPLFQNDQVKDLVHGSLLHWWSL